MFEPWDTLRVATQRPPIGEGAWKSAAGSQVWVNLSDRNCGHGDKVGLSFGTDSSEFCFWQPEGLRELSRFAIALADQMEGA